MFSDLFGITFIFLGIFIACLVGAKKEAGRAVKENSLFFLSRLPTPFGTCQAGLVLQKGTNDGNVMVERTTDMSSLLYQHVNSKFQGEQRRTPV